MTVLRLLCRSLLALSPVIVLLAAGCGAQAFRTGLEVLEADGFAALRGKRVALVTNPTGVNRRLESAIDLLAQAPAVELAAVFGPEHGARGAAQAGVKVADARDPRTGVPVHSLYGSVRRPTAAMLEGIDVILFDIQDIGVRTYTYLATLLEVLEAAAEHDIELWVLDRPVPLGGTRCEGPMLDPDLESFVGPHSLPLRHGLTAGEFARLAVAERGIGARLQVVRMQGYRRGMRFEETGLAWVAPSPNIPTPAAALVYAGTVLIEGTNLSEGRGTTRPFQLIGAPWLDGFRLAAELNALGLAGVRFREARFTPAASKFAGEECGGIEIHVTGAAVYEPVAAAVVLIETVRRLHPEELRFRAETFDRLAGTRALREAIESGIGFRDIAAGWEKALGEYRERRAVHLLYD
jgi:uncharacterized protein YbbC (DUF1343 family)